MPNGLTLRILENKGIIGKISKLLELPRVQSHLQKQKFDIGA